MTKDLTSGSPLKVILLFTLPLVLGNLFQQFYALADTIIVGRFCGVSALASVGSTGSINYLILGFVIGICNGFAIPIAQLFGARDYSDLRRHVANAAWLCIAFSVVLTITTVALTRPMLVLMQTPEDILDGAVVYIGWIFASIPFIFLYNMVAGIMRALGDSKTPLYFLILTSVLNIGLDLLFIVPFKMGILGAALATDISQAISGVVSFAFLCRKFEVLHMQKGEWAVSKRACVRLMGIGVPMGLQYSITAIGSVILQVAVNSLGSLSVAAVTAARALPTAVTRSSISACLSPCPATPPPAARRKCSACSTPTPRPPRSSSTARHTRSSWFCPTTALPPIRRLPPLPTSCPRAFPSSSALTAPARPWPAAPSSVRPASPPSA